MITEKVVMQFENSPVRYRKEYDHN